MLLLGCWLDGACTDWMFDVASFKFDLHFSFPSFKLPKIQHSCCDIFGYRMSDCYYRSNTHLAEVILG